MLDKFKIAIVYDWIDKWGGVERILLYLHQLFPHADFYASFYDLKKAPWAKDIKIQSSFIQRLPSLIKNSRTISLPLFPYAFESFNFSNYDLVISVTSSFAKSIITKPNTLHVCYLLTPTRYLWLYPEKYISPFTRKLLSGYISYIRTWDYISAQRPDKIISISKTVADRCKKYYHRESEIIYPPFDTEYWDKIKSEILNSKFQINSKFKLSNSKFYLIVSRLEPYKNVDLVINVFNKHSDLKLIIVGEGSQEKKLKATARNNIQFFSQISDDKLAFLYQNAQALITPQEEDFGYVALESRFFGCPVIYYNEGGIPEIIINNQTGLSFKQQTEDSLYQAIERFHTISYNLKEGTLKLGKTNIERFSKNRFEKKFIDFIISNIKNHL